MTEHFYNSLMVLHYCGTMLCIIFVKFDREKNELIDLSKNTKLFRRWAKKPIVIFLLLDTTYAMAKKSVWTKVELIYAVQLPVLYVCVYHFLTFRNHSMFSEILNTLHSIDVELSKYYTYRMTNRSINHILIVLSLLYAIAFALNGPLIWIYCFRPETKLLTLQAILGANILSLVWITNMIMYILSDRTYILRRIIERFFNENIPRSTCDICNYSITNQHLCKDHQIKYVLAMYTNIIMLTNKIIKFSNLFGVPIYFAAMFQAPGVGVIVVSSIFRNHMGLELDVHTIFITYCLFIFGTLASFLISNSADMLNYEIEQVAKTFHKLYLNHTKKIDIRETIAISSIYMMQEKPTFLFAYILYLNRVSFITIFNAVVLFTFLVLQSNI